jgi:hypothetical protein
MNHFTAPLGLAVNPDNLKPVNIPEIIAIAGQAEPKMITLSKP